MRDLVGVATWARLTAGLCLVLHLFLVGVGSAVDANLEAEALASAGAADHVEDPRDADCGLRHHDHRYCLVCRSLDALDAPPAATPVVAAALVQAGPAREYQNRSPLHSVVSALGARAPPLL